MSERVKPFGDLADFSPSIKPKVSAADHETIDLVATESGFPSRQPVKDVPIDAVRGQRRYTTGRNKQVNVKATASTIENFYRIADDLRVPLGEVLSRALNALELVRKA